MVVVSRRSSEQTAVDRLDCRGGRTTQLAIVHYHLNRGGVTQVIINQLAPPSTWLSRRNAPGESFSCLVVAVSIGQSSCPTNWDRSAWT